jgi:FtsZ-binding cell division protein ZapB
VARLLQEAEALRTQSEQLRARSEQLQRRQKELDEKIHRLLGTGNHDPKG